MKNKSQQKVIGVYVGENESSKFWLSMLSDLKKGVVKDILIFCADALSGIKEAISAAGTQGYLRKIFAKVNSTLTICSNLQR